MGVFFVLWLEGGFKTHINEFLEQIYNAVFPFFIWGGGGDFGKVPTKCVCFKEPSLFGRVVF